MVNYSGKIALSEEEFKQQVYEHYADHLSYGQTYYTKERLIWMCDCRYAVVGNLKAPIELNFDRIKKINWAL